MKFVTIEKHSMLVRVRVTICVYIVYKIQQELH